MTQQNPALPIGYSPLPPGHLANLVAYLEMTSQPDVSALRALPDGYSLRRMGAADTNAYRALFRRVGEDWLWFSRLGIAEEALLGILNDPAIESYALHCDGVDVGILELDFRESGACELVYFGLGPDQIGKGVARLLMDQAIGMAWSRPIQRFWLHTCHFDHPRALGFYKSCGFKIYKFEVEVAPDPRLTGELPKHLAPHVPMID
jgi:GNAT superfamily N-acetyltransferase